MRGQAFGASRVTLGDRAPVLALRLAFAAMWLGAALAKALSLRELTSALYASNLFYPIEQMQAISWGIIALRNEVSKS